MFILIEDNGTDRRKIYLFSNDPIQALPNQECVEIAGNWPGGSISNYYFDYALQELVAYTQGEIFNNYKDKILQKIQDMGFSVLEQYKNVVLYIDFKEARGDTIGTALQNIRTVNWTKYITGVDWLRTRADAIRAAETRDEVIIEYIAVVRTYLQKKEVVI